ncbi:ABC transporter ATP-binding protein [Candidatus Poribacteria bacterium]|nr:ABC transporter ATP-binding protein [Candidatus Poribacteria bacterium]
MTPSGQPVTVEFRDVTKRYHILQRATPRLGAWVVNKLFEHLRREPFLALDGVSLSISRGEMAGFLGANGAGKSTVLKLTAGITQPTSGTVRTRGRIASLLELGIGFHPELSGMENIFYNAAIMGLSRDEVFERLERIIEFSGLRKFLYEPVKHYSSGMYARLACSVALHLDPDIILVDEILAVGDAEFQQRGMARVLQMHEEGATILLVTHSVSTARDLCDRLYWIDHGRIQMEGEPREVAREYLRHMSKFSILPRHFLSQSQKVISQTDAATLHEAGLDEYAGSPVPRLGSIRLEDASGGRVETVETREAVRFTFDVDGAGAVFACKLAFCVKWSDGRILFEDGTGLLAPGVSGTVVYEVPSWPLLRGSMTVSAALLTDTDPPVVLDRAVDVLKFTTRTSETIHVDDIIHAPEAAWSVTKCGM